MIEWACILGPHTMQEVAPSPKFLLLTKEFWYSLYIYIYNEKMTSTQSKDERLEILGIS